MINDSESVVKKYQQPAWKRSRIAYWTECVFGYFGILLMSDAYLAKLLTEAGMDDALIGVISSLVSFAFLFSLFSIPLMQKIREVKKTVILFETLSNVFFFGAYMICVAPVTHIVRVILIFLFIGGGYFCRYLVASMYYQWANSFVRPSLLARFSAVKELISLVCAILFTLGVGAAFDHLESQGKMRQGFLMLAVIMFSLGLCSFISLVLITGDHPEDTEKKHRTLREIRSEILQNNGFRRMTALTAMYDFACYLTLGFLGTYKINELGLSVGTVQIINTCAFVARIIVSIPFGTYSDRKSYCRGYRTATLICALGFLFSAFASPSRVWPIIVFSILYHVSLAGIESNASNMCYDCVSSDSLTQAMAIRSAISGAAGFLGSLVGSSILTAVQNAENVFGMTVYGQQLLSVVSCVILCLAGFIVGPAAEKSRTLPAEKE